MTGYDLIRPLLFSLDPERAHRLALNVLARGLHPRPERSHPALARNLAGLTFPNPIGIAAGFDKNGEVPDALLALGFGFAEVGTVTPLPQTGNPKPRLFRLPEHAALINRLGFFNAGFDVVHRRIAARTGRGGVVGVNIGANRDSADRAADYAAGITRFADVADYFTVNISSPNTPGLRDLQESRALRDLLDRVTDARAAGPRHVPIFLKIAPDLDDAAATATVETAVAAGIEGMIVANTTIARDAVDGHPMANEAGGLSGRPLFEPSTAMLARIRKTAGDRLVLIGLGGVHSAETALTKILAGADLVQLYTGLVYEGPGLPGRILTELPELVKRAGAERIGELVGRDMDVWIERHHRSAG